jgi:hypothetical protein
MTAYRYMTGSVRKFIVIAAVAVALGFGSTGWAQADGPKPALNLVSVGISKYTRMNPLMVAHKNSQDVARLFEAQQGKLFGQVQVTNLIDHQGTVANILAAVQQAKARATPDSYTIIYLAGHGGKANFPEYAYCAYDYNLNWSVLQTALRGTPGKVMVILDTCEAASATAGDGLVVFCGCLAHEGGQEDIFPTGNGYFTKVLLRALSGAADANGDGTVTLDEVNAYVSARLSQISNGTQHSQVYQPVTVQGSLPLTQVAPTSPIMPVTAKPATFTPAASMGF